MKCSDESKKGKNTLAEIERLRLNRENRRKAMEDARKDRADLVESNAAMGIQGDVDFQNMITKSKAKMKKKNISMDYINDSHICVTVRKRPINNRELQELKELDCVTVCNPSCVIHDCKFKVDGITKFLDNQSFRFDQVYSEKSDTSAIYVSACRPLVTHTLNGGLSTIFAYGQTGSGKTFTMLGIEKLLSNELMDVISKSKKKAWVSMYEIYGGRCYDLLNKKERLVVQEDKNNEVRLPTVVEKPASSPNEMSNIIAEGNDIRTTHATALNPDSSRSHAIVTITLRDGPIAVGKLTLVDLAGSERANDTKSHNRQRRIEGAEINKSLLALKECIRALDSPSASHVPFRASKLTFVLRESFVARKARTLMIACVSPVLSSADHTLNTLRYASRLKDHEKPNVGGGGGGALGGGAPQGGGAPLAPGGTTLGIKLKKNITESSQRSEISADSKIKNQNLSMNLVNDEDSHSDAGFLNEVEDDWRESSKADTEFLKETLRAETRGGLEGYGNETQIEHLEVVDSLCALEDDILSGHMYALQEDARMLIEEGELLSAVQSCVDYDIDQYVDAVERIVESKIEVYCHLHRQLREFKIQLQREEKVAQSG
eukprot:GHVL01035825.1.p1 GENE.GHVL01035825.1~~GHVL01035825.1.p1  ORF type:complete len:604 (+),score=122.79 GHVL01035825.1:57-1868(+)